MAACSVSKSWQYNFCVTIGSRDADPPGICFRNATINLVIKIRKKVARSKIITKILNFIQGAWKKSEPKKVGKIWDKKKVGQKVGKNVGENGKVTCCVGKGRDGIRECRRVFGVLWVNFVLRLVSFRVRLSCFCGSGGECRGIGPQRERETSGGPTP